MCERRTERRRGRLELRRGFDANQGPADGAEILLGVDPAPLRLTALAAPRRQRGLSGTPIAVATKVPLCPGFVGINAVDPIHLETSPTANGKKAVAAPAR
jgi:hypothetical protein